MMKVLELIKSGDYHLKFGLFEGSAINYFLYTISHTHPNTGKLNKTKIQAVTSSDPFQKLNL